MVEEFIQKRLHRFTSDLLHLKVNLFDWRLYRLIMKNFYVIYFFQAIIHGKKKTLKKRSNFERSPFRQFSTFLKNFRYNLQFI